MLWDQVWKGVEIKRKFPLLYQKHCKSLAIDQVPLTHALSHPSHWISLFLLSSVQTPQPEKLPLLRKGWPPLNTQIHLCFVASIWFHTMQIRFHLGLLLIFFLIFSFPGLLLLLLVSSLSSHSQSLLFSLPEKACYTAQGGLKVKITLPQFMTAGISGEHCWRMLVGCLLPRLPK